jgi:hypothetical protein
MTLHYRGKQLSTDERKRWRPDFTFTILYVIFLRWYMFERNTGNIT